MFCRCSCYRSKTQSINALSSTEAYLIAAVTAVNTARLLSSVIWEPGIPQDCLVPIYKGNDHTIDIVDSIIPTERTHHIYIQLFAIKG